MQRLLFIIGILLSSTVIASQVFSVAKAPFAGPYAGASLGYAHVEMTNARTTRIFLPSALNVVSDPSSQPVTSNTVIGGFVFGYSVIIKRVFLLGIEGRANLESADMNNNNSIIEKNSDFNLDTDVSTTLKKDFSFLLKFGAIIEPKTLFYGLIGPQWGDFSISTSSHYRQNLNPPLLTAATQNNHSQYEMGLLLGLGIERLITKNMSIALEYTYTDYGTLHYPRTATGVISADGVPQSNSFISDANKISAKNNNVLLKVTYYLT